MTEFSSHFVFFQNLYGDIRIGQAMFRPAESELRSDG